MYNGFNAFGMTCSYLTKPPPSPPPPGWRKYGVVVKQVGLWIQTA